MVHCGPIAAALLALAAAALLSSGRGGGGGAAAQQLRVAPLGGRKREGWRAAVWGLPLPLRTPA